MVGDAGLRSPEAKVHPLRRLQHNLAVAAAYVNTTILYEIVPVLGAQKVTARFKGTAAGTLDMVFVGPDFPPYPDPATAFASLKGTLYATGNPTQVAITANTEALITGTCNGEGFVIIKFTGTATGAVTYCDVATLGLSIR